MVRVESFETVAAKPPRCSLDAIPMPRPAPDHTFHIVLLVMSLSVPVAAWLLEVRGEQQVAVRWIDFTLPGTCSFYRVTGIPCPGCGLTRCFVSLAHGDWRRAWHFNPAGFLVFAIVVSQIPYRTWQLIRLQRKMPELVFWDWPSKILWGTFALLIAQWLVRAGGVFF